MYTSYTVGITSTEFKSLQFVMIDQDEWVNNALKTRARVAKDEIVALNTAHCNENNIAIAVGVDAQVEQAYTLGIVKTAEQRNAENDS